MAKTVKPTSPCDPLYCCMVKYVTLAFSAGVAFLVLGICMMIAYSWWAERPSRLEKEYLHPVEDAITYDREPFLLKDALSWPWDKLCVVSHERDLGIAVDMSSASRDTSYDRRVIVFFYKDQKPWGIRIPNEYLPRIKSGDCINNDYLFPIE